MKTDHPITVLHFVNEPVRGGVEEHMLRLLIELDRTRFRPMLVAPMALVEMLRPDLPTDVDVVPLTLRSPAQLLAAWRFWRLLQQRRVGILHTHMFQASKFSSPLGWLARVPVVIETTHVREHWRRGWFKGSYVIDRFVGHFVTTFIAVSAANGEYLKNEKRMPAKKITVIRNGTPLERFDPKHVAPPELRQSLGIEEHAPVVVMLARLEPQKGHRVLLDAWKSVSAAVPEARLVCVGTGSLADDLKAQAAALGITSSVRFAGYQPNAADWLALAEFTVLPSFYEGLPLVAVESLATARPVVATAVDGSAEVVLDGQTGLTVPPGESAPLAAAICRLLSAPDLARRLGQAGRRLVEARFSQRQQVAETEALYLNEFRCRTGAAAPYTVPSFSADSTLLARKPK
jgi:glycosyltransferase involved in cell wall biosynthesis